jgi:Homeodomain-like domain
MAKPRKKTIGELEDELKERDERIKELRRELSEAEELVSDMREQVEDADRLIDSWIEAFDMVQNDDGKWTYNEWVNICVAARDKYLDLRKEWNRFVPQYNAVVAPRLRNFGRPLGVDEDQRKRVLKLRDAGKSLRTIAEELEVGVRTVRTVIDQRDGVDRTTLKHLERIDPDRKEETLWRAHSRVRKALPKRITETLERGRELVKAAKGLR